MHAPLPAARLRTARRRNAGRDGVPRRARRCRRRRWRPSPAPQSAAASTIAPHGVIIPRLAGPNRRSRGDEGEPMTNGPTVEGQLDRPPTSHRIITLIAVVLPPLGLLAVIATLWGVRRRARRPRHLRSLLRDPRPRHHGRIPPLLHASQLRDRPRDQGGARRARLDDLAGPGRPVGLRPPQASRAFRRRGRSALAARRQRLRA